MKAKHFLSSAATFALLVYADVAYGQDGVAGIESATTKVSSYLPALQKLLYVIGAVVGLIGAIQVYSKWNRGDQDTQKTAVSWFGSMIFLVVVGTIIGAFFGQSGMGGGK